jgi:hypothetical protein
VISAPLIFALVKLALVTVAPDKSTLVRVAPTKDEPETFARVSEAPVRFVLVRMESVKVAPVNTAFVIVELANVVPVIVALPIDAPVKITEDIVEFRTIAPVITTLVIVAPAKVVPDISAFAIDAPAKFTEVNVEFLTVALVITTFGIVALAKVVPVTTALAVELVITAFTRDAPANEVPDTVVPDNEAPLISTLSKTLSLVIVPPCNAEPASVTVITQLTLGGALYNAEDACDTMTVAVPAPLRVTRPVEEFTVSTLLELGSLSA